MSPKLHWKIKLEKILEAELRIHISWNKETFYRVLELLDTNIETVAITRATDGKLIWNDIEKIHNVFAMCPIVHHLRFRGFWTTLAEYRNKMNIVRKLHALRAICLLDCNCFIDILKLPEEITEFKVLFSATSK